MDYFTTPGTAHRGVYFTATVLDVRNIGFFSPRRRGYAASVLLFAGLLKRFIARTQTVITIFQGMENIAAKDRDPNGQALCLLHAKARFSKRIDHGSEYRSSKL